MPVPDFQSFMRPALDFFSDGELKSLKDARATLAKKLNLTAEDLGELLPSGSQTKYDSRVSWAIVYLAKAQALAKESRGNYRITDRGRELLREYPDRIEVKILRKFPEFLEFHQAKNDDFDDKPNLPPGVSNETPEERIEAGFKELNQALAADLLELMRRMPPVAFERLVVKLLVKMGYGGSIEDAGRAVGQSGDEGIDGIIKEDKLGLDNIYVQAKRWSDQQVGSRVVREFIGSLSVKRARKGVLITTSRFSPDAMNQAHGLDMKVVLIDGQQLASLLIEHNVGVSELRSFVIKKLDTDYFEDV